MAAVQLKPGREKSLLRRHPWIFSGAVERVRGAPADGDTVDVISNRGEFLGQGAYSSRSQISVRIWSWRSEEAIDDAFFRQRLSQSIALRRKVLSPLITNAMRLVHGESDGLPGLVVDQYDTTLVMQCLSSGAERWREVLADQLLELTGVERIYERSDADVRQLEGLPLRSGSLRGSPPPRLQIHENGLYFWVDVGQGHKTGFYLDQRANRLRVRQLANNLEVLDCFSYSGGFASYCLAGGAAQVTAVDSSAAALALIDEHVALNQLPAGKIHTLEGDVFQVLRGFRDQRRDFDMIILDPPKFAPTAAQAARAARGYKDINLLAFKLLRPGGILVTFSCSGGVSPDLFQKIVAGAAQDAGVDALITERLFQDVDHPVALSFPEGLYLKGLVLVKAG